MAGQLASIFNGITNLLGSTSLLSRSTTFGTERLTIDSNKAVGTTQACKSVMVVTDGADVYMAVKAAGDASLTDFLLTRSLPMPVPVDNCNKLRFYGGTNGKRVYLLWRS